MPVRDRRNRPELNITWQEHARCRGMNPDIWYPAKKGDISAPVWLCWTECPVRSSCETHALIRPELFGWWGGRSPGWLRRRRRALPLAATPEARRKRAKVRQRRRRMTVQRLRRTSVPNRPALALIRGDRPAGPTANHAEHSKVSGTLSLVRML